MIRLPVQLKISFCLMVFMSCLFQGVARDLYVDLEADSVEIGELIKMTGNEAFPQIEEAVSAGWELVSFASDQLLFQIFEPGIYPLPVLRGANEDEIQLVSDQKVLVVTFPKSVTEDAALRTIEGPVSVNQSWLVRSKWILTLTGAISFCLILLWASLRSYGPDQKNPPPGSTLAVLRKELIKIQQDGEPDLQLSNAQMLFRKYLVLMGQKDAGSATIEELETATLLPFGSDETDRIFNLLKQSDQHRFGGAAVGKQEAASLLDDVGKVLRATNEEMIPREEGYGQLYGNPPSPWSRIIAGIIDLLPITLMMLGFLNWPELLATLPWTPTGIGMTILVSLGSSLLGKSMIEWLGITSAWQASPGMRIMRLAVVPTSGRLWLRPWVSLIASIPGFLGHLGIFSRSRQSLVDTFSRSNVRYYDSEPE